MMRPGAWRILGFVVLASAFGSSQTQAADARLVPLDGAASTVDIERLDEHAVTFGSAGRRVEIQSLQRIERAVKPEPKRVSAIVHLVDGSIIRAAALEIATDKARLRWGGEPLTLPLSVVRGIRLAAPEAGKTDPPAVASFEAALAKPGKQDALYVPVDGQWQVVEGALQQLDANELAFIWNGQVRKLSRAQPYGITFAATKPPPDLTGLCQARLVDGSLIWGKVKSLESGKLTLAAHESTIVIPWAAVTQLRVRSERVTYLSDLDPVEVVEQALVAFAGPWRRDRSVRNNPLTLGTVTYERGIGTHAHSSLTFAADGKYAAFSATIGIDAETKGKGDCVFKVLADGKELHSQRMRGTDAAANVRVNIAGAQRVTLLVEAGEDLDIADHANWCDARFEKSAAAPR